MSELDDMVFSCSLIQKRHSLPRRQEGLCGTHITAARGTYDLFSFAHTEAACAYSLP